MESIPFSSIVSDIPVGITVLRGPSFIVEMANPMYLQLVDRKEEQIVGRPLFESLPEVREAVEPLLNDVYFKAIPYHGQEFPAPLKRQGKIEIGYFNFVYQPAYDSNGNVNGIIVVANEVTPNVIARQKLSESEHKFREVVMRSHFAMTIFMGEDLVIDIANQKLLDTLWRTTADKVVGKKLYDAFPELKDQKFPALLREVYETGRRHSEEEAIVYIDGVDGMRKFFIDFAYEPLFDKFNKVFGIFVTVADVTERVEYRTRIEEAEAKSRLAIESAQLGTYEVDIDTNETKVSERFLQIFGFTGPATRDEMIERIHPDDREGRKLAHAEALRTGHLFYETRLLRPDNQLCWMRAIGAVLFDKAGKPKTLVGVIQDITEQKIFSDELERQVQLRTEELQAASEEITATNEELAETNNKLVTANFELEQFNYAASHDLQEPVRKIQTFVSYLTAEGTRASFERKSEYINKIKTAAERMKSIIDDLLLYARHTKTEKQLVSTDLNEVMEAVTSELDLMAEEKKAKVEIENLPTIAAIPSQMHQLFRNLLSNSLKFTKPGVTPLIKVSSKTEANGKIHITFSDNGIGFDQEFAEYIFKLFKRLHTKSAYDGTGIGLSLCKKIVENHGGDIYAKSVPDQGTTMHIILPSRS